MSIVKMKRLRIFGMASDCEELLRKLQHLGCVELRAPTQPSSDPGWQGFTAKSDGELANAQLRMDEFRTTLERLKRCSPTNKKGRFPSRPRITERELFDRQIVLEAEETVERVAALEKKRDSMEVDWYSSYERQDKMIQMILDYDKLCRAAIEKGAATAELFAIPFREQMGRAKSVPDDRYAAVYADMAREMEEQIADIAARGGAEV